MTKKTILKTLLFTTVLSSGVSIAMDSKDLFSPETQRKVGQLVQTPDILKNAESKYSENDHTPFSRRFQIDLEVQQQKLERDALKAQLEAASKAKQSEKNRNLEKQRLEQQNKEEVDALIKQLTELRTNLTNNNSIKEETEKKVQELTIQISQLNDKNNEMAKLIEAEKKKKVSVINSAASALSEMEKNLRENKATIERLMQEREHLLGEKEILEIRTHGLSNKISLYNTHLAEMTLETGGASVGKAAEVTFSSNPADNPLATSAPNPLSSAKAEGTPVTTSNPSQPLASNTVAHNNTTHSSDSKEDGETERKRVNLREAGKAGKSQNSGAEGKK